MRARLAHYENNDISNEVKYTARVLGYEFTRLEKQRCPYCDGFGHSGNDCPTDHKIAQLRGGVLEQNRVIQVIRKECRVASGMANVTGFSLLTADPKKGKLGKRKFTETQSEDDKFSFKRRKF